MLEEWVDIKGFEGLYKISNTGNVFSMPKVWSNGIGGKARGSHNGKILKNVLDSRGYLRTVLTKNNIKHQFHTHRLVAISFIDNPLNLPQVNHRNGIKTDNHIDNLEWVTSSQNVVHAYDTGLTIPAKGEAKHNRKLNNEQVVLIKEIYSNGGISQRSLAKIYQVSQTCIAQVIEGRTWKHINN